MNVEFAHLDEPLTANNLLCKNCDSPNITMMAGCSILHYKTDRETVQRGWFCKDCKSGGTIDYLIDITTQVINVRAETKGV